MFLKAWFLGFYADSGTTSKLFLTVFSTQSYCVINCMLNFIANIMNLNSVVHRVTVT